MTGGPTWATNPKARTRSGEQCGRQLLAWLGSIGLPARCALLSLSVWGFFAIVGGFLWLTRGWMSVAAAAVAALICWTGGMFALLFGQLFSGPQRALHAALIGMFFRMGVPLAGGLWLHYRGGALAESGVFGLVLLFYFWTLIVETCLSLPTLGAGKGLSKVV